MLVMWIVRGVVAAVLVGAGLAWGAEYRVASERSVFAMIVHKGGLASALAHNHFIFPERYELTLTHTAGAATTADFALSFRAEDLVVDLPEAQTQWFPLIKELGILEKPYSALGEEDRAKIRRTMLGAGQLDAATYPTLGAELTGIVKAESAPVPGFDYTATVALTVRGVTVEAPYVARIVEGEDGSLTITAAGSYLFTDFGMAPFSGLWGAIQNQDRFHILAHFEAVRVEETEPEP